MPKGKQPVTPQTGNRRPKGPPTAGAPVTRSAAPKMSSAPALDDSQTGQDSQSAVDSPTTPRVTARDLTTVEAEDHSDAEDSSPGEEEATVTGGMLPPPLPAAMARDDPPQSGKPLPIGAFGDLEYPDLPEGIAVPDAAELLAAVDRRRPRPEAIPHMRTDSSSAGLPEETLSVAGDVSKLSDQMEVLMKTVHAMGDKITTLLTNYTEVRRENTQLVTDVLEIRQNLKRLGQVELAIHSREGRDLSSEDAAKAAASSSEATATIQALRAEVARSSTVRADDTNLRVGEPSAKRQKKYRDE